MVTPGHRDNFPCGNRNAVLPVTLAVTLGIAEVITQTVLSVPHRGDVMRDATHPQVVGRKIFRTKNFQAGGLSAAPPSPRGDAPRG